MQVGTIVEMKVLECTQFYGSKIPFQKSNKMCNDISLQVKLTNNERYESLDK